VELSGRGRRLLPDLKRAWVQLAERTTAELGTTSVEHLTDVLAELAQGLTAD
jgi:hypothetical protein